MLYTQPFGCVHRERSRKYNLNNFAIAMCAVRMVSSISPLSVFQQLNREDSGLLLPGDSQELITNAMFAYASHICHEFRSFSITAEPRDYDNQRVKTSKFQRKILGNTAKVRGLTSRLLNDDDQGHLINHGYRFANKMIFTQVVQWLQRTDLENGGLAIDDSDMIR